MKSAYSTFIDAIGGDKTSQNLPYLLTIMTLGKISTGKSSTIELITNYEVFPKEKGFATKRPIQFSFNQNINDFVSHNPKKQLKI